MTAPPMARFVHVYPDGLADNPAPRRTGARRGAPERRAVNALRIIIALLGQGQQRQTPPPSSASGRHSKLAIWQIGKLVGSCSYKLRVTFAPQKDINIRLPVGGPCFSFFWGVFLALLGSSSLRSRWAGGHRVLYVVPAAAVRVPRRHPSC